MLPDNGEERPSPVSSLEARTRRNWWHKAKDFIINNCPMYDVGDNTKLHISRDNTKLHISHINANVVLIGNQPTPGTSSVEQVGGKESDDQPESHPPGPEIPAPAQDSVGSRDEGPQIILAQSPTAAQTNCNLTTLNSDCGTEFDSEATAEYTDPDVPSISSASYPHTSRARTHIYSFGMLTHRAGYPLYMPTPLGGLPTAYRKKGIRVGDVGVITANGAFDFLFNACKYDDRSDAGINPDILPDGFELLKPRIRTSAMFGPDICLPTDHVREIGDGNLSAFQCLAAEGAVLVLPKGATLYEAVNKVEFRNHAARHAVSWYEYMLNEGRDISNGSLYFVTECIKSVNWGIAVFYAHPIADDHLRFIVTEESCRWERRGKVDSRIGPDPKDITISNDDEPNQCAFLRGYKIMLRSDIWDKLKSAVAATSQDGEFSSSPSTGATRDSPSQGTSGSQADSFHQSSSGNCNTPNSSYGAQLASQLMHTQTLPGSQMQGVDVYRPETSSDWLGQVILEEGFREEAPLHPSDLINVMLLHLKSEAKVALVHDSEWCNNLPRDFIADPVNPNVDGLLENIKRSCKVVIGENESAILVKWNQKRRQASFEIAYSKKATYLQHELWRNGPPTTSMQSQTVSPSTDISLELPVALDNGSEAKEPQIPLTNSDPFTLPPDHENTFEKSEETVDYMQLDVPSNKPEIISNASRNSRQSSVPVPIGQQKPVGSPVTFISGQFFGKTVRTELQEIQQAKLGRKYVKVDRRRLDPPSMVLLKYFTVNDVGTFNELEQEIDDYRAILNVGIMCSLDLFPIPRRQPMLKTISNGEQPQDVVHRIKNHLITESSKLTPALVGIKFTEPVLVDYQGKDCLIFVFGDLAVQREGTFVLRYRVFDILSAAAGSDQHPILAECFGGPFRVYLTRDFPGLQASTELTKSVARYGVPITTRDIERKSKGPKRHRSNSNDQSSEEDISQGFDGNVGFRDPREVR
ncbi:hypothetical protein AX14_003508 [Amanita brunnescens Koide BX004]|nr:hypothetical protein AX14_003508 [Amanita brunnescens Koide BX004]